MQRGALSQEGQVCLCIVDKPPWYIFNKLAWNHFHSKNGTSKNNEQVTPHEQPHSSLTSSTTHPLPTRCQLHAKNANRIYKSHNNQLIQILFASGLALDEDSIMESRGNTTIMVEIIEEV